MTAESVWDAAQVEEAWQIELWGEDEDGVEAAAMKRQGFIFAAKLLKSVM